MCLVRHKHLHDTSKYVSTHRNDETMPDFKNPNNLLLKSYACHQKQHTNCMSGSCPFSKSHKNYMLGLHCLKNNIKIYFDIKGKLS